MLRLVDQRKALHDVGLRPVSPVETRGQALLDLEAQGLRLLQLPPRLLVQAGVDPRQRRLHDRMPGPAAQQPRQEERDGSAGQASQQELQRIHSANLAATSPAESRVVRLPARPSLCARAYAASTQIGLDHASSPLDSNTRT